VLLTCFTSTKVQILTQQALVESGDVALHLRAEREGQGLSVYMNSVVFSKNDPFGTWGLEVHDKFKRRSELSEEQGQGTPATPATGTEGLLSYTRISTIESHVDNCKEKGGSDSDENATFEPDADFQRRLERRQQLQAFGGVWKNVMGARYKRAHARVKWVVSVDKEGFHLRSHDGEVRSSLPAQFTCFTSTKVQILTALVTAQESRSSFAHRLVAWRKGLSLSVHVEEGSVVVVKTWEGHVTGQVHSAGAQGRNGDLSADSGPGASETRWQWEGVPPHAGTVHHAATSAHHASTSPHCRGAQRQIAAQVPASPVERHCRASDEQGRSGGGRVVKAGAAAQEHVPPRANFCAP